MLSVEPFRAETKRINEEEYYGGEEKKWRLVDLKETGQFFSSL